MKLQYRRRGYKFRPYSPRRRHLRDWQGWTPIAVLIVLIVAAIVLRACICG